MKHSTLREEAMEGLSKTELFDLAQESERLGVVHDHDALWIMISSNARALSAARAAAESCAAIAEISEELPGRIESLISGSDVIEKLIKRSAGSVIHAEMMKSAEDVSMKFVQAAEKFEMGKRRWELAIRVFVALVALAGGAAGTYTGLSAYGYLSDRPIDNCKVYRDGTFCHLNDQGFRMPLIK